jgi:hypothetical protein
MRLDDRKYSIDVAKGLIDLYCALVNEDLTTQEPMGLRHRGVPLASYLTRKMSVTLTRMVAPAYWAMKERAQVMVLPPPTSVVVPEDNSPRRQFAHDNRICHSVAQTRHAGFGVDGTEALRPPRWTIGSKFQNDDIAGR